MASAGFLKMRWRTAAREAPTKDARWLRWDDLLAVSMAGGDRNGRAMTQLGLLRRAAGRRERGKGRDLDF
jgi:hypothetical protein